MRVAEYPRVNSLIQGPLVARKCRDALPVEVLGGTCSLELWSKVSYYNRNLPALRCFSGGLPEEFNTLKMKGIGIETSSTPLSV